MLFFLGPKVVVMSVPEHSRVLTGDGWRQGMSLGCGTGVVVAVDAGFGEKMGGLVWGRHISSGLACLFLS